jgi:hypothetical protein
MRHRCLPLVSTVRQLAGTALIVQGLSTLIVPGRVGASERMAVLHKAHPSKVHGATAAPGQAGPKTVL